MRLRFRISLALTLAAASSAGRDAGAQQEIKADTTWTAQGSPHLVSEDTTVRQGVVLTIEPGATVQLAEGRRLIIAGALRARGTASRPIRFTAAPAGPGAVKARWGSLVFTSSSVGAAFDGAGVYASGSILEHCTLERASRAIQLSGAAPFIHRCTFRDNRFESTTDPRGGAALMITGGSAPRVTSCTFESNAAPSAEGGAIYTSASAPVLQDNTFTNNSSTYGGALAATGLYAPVVGNTFIGNSAQFEGGAASFTSSAPAFLNNRVERNYAAADGGGVHVCVDCSPHANPLFLDNTITGNSNLLHVGAAGVGAAYVRVFRYNNLHGNRRKSGVQSDFGWFHPLSEGYPAWVAEPDLARNWWGTTDAAAIARAIFDGDDDSRYGKVRFTPQLQGPVRTPQTRVTITTLKIRYKEPGEPMPVYLTIYNPGAARQVHLVLALQYGARPPVVVRSKPQLPGAVSGSEGVRLALPANSVHFTRLMAPTYNAAGGLGHGTWHATLLDAKTSARIGDTCSARFELGAGGTP